MEQLILFIAMACHEANKAWCESVGDYSQKHWHEAEEWQRESAVKGVQFRLDNPNASESAQHDSWMAEKVAAGWVYGETKDAEAKTHPCIVPFHELPEHQQKKDKLFCAIVDALKPESTVLEHKNGYAGEVANLPQPTYEQKAVGYAFNPGGSQEVNDCKSVFAAAIDQMNALRSASLSPEQKRLASVAITEAQGAQMWAVKALTWRD